MRLPAFLLLRTQPCENHGNPGEAITALTIKIGKPLSPTALKSLQDEISCKADHLVGGLVAKGTFCAITELATFLPVDIVASAVGLPEDGRERMLVWAAQMFNCFGPLNDRARGAFPVLRDMNGLCKNAGCSWQA